MFKKILHYFTPGEWLLWLGSLALISLSFALFDRENILTLAASLVGRLRSSSAPRATRSGRC